MNIQHIALTLAGLGMIGIGLSNELEPAQPPTLCNHDAFHQELAAQREELEALKQEHADTRVLAAFGGIKMRGAKGLRLITCDGSIQLPNSFGEMAWRAGDASGICKPSPELPVPELTRR